MKLPALPRRISLKSTLCAAAIATVSSALLIATAATQQALAGRPFTSCLGPFSLASLLFLGGLFLIEWGHCADSFTEG